MSSKAALRCVTASGITRSERRRGSSDTRAFELLVGVDLVALEILDVQLPPGSKAFDKDPT